MATKKKPKVEPKREPIDYHSWRCCELSRFSNYHNSNCPNYQK